MSASHPAADEEVADPANVFRPFRPRLQRAPGQRRRTGQPASRAARRSRARRPGPDLQPADITAGADAGDALVRARRSTLFCAIFGSIAGDAALALGAWDGVFSAADWCRAAASAAASGFRAALRGQGSLRAGAGAGADTGGHAPQPGLLGAAAIACDRRAGAVCDERTGSSARGRRASTTAATTMQWTWAAAVAIDRRPAARAGTRAPRPTACCPAARRRRRSSARWRRRRWTGDRVDIGLVDERWLLPSDQTAMHTWCSAHLLRNQAAAARFETLTRAGRSIEAARRAANLHARRRPA